MSIIEVILKVAETLFGLLPELTKADQTRRDKVADYLSLTALTVEETGKSLKRGVYPHGKCQELYIHSQNMADVIGDVVGRSKAEELGSELGRVHEIERLYVELHAEGADSKRRMLANLDKAVGTLRATAACVRAGRY